MGGELGLAPEAHAIGLGGPAPIVGALDDAVALVLGHGGEEGDKAAEWGLSNHER